MKTTYCLLAVVAGLVTSVVASRAAAVDAQKEKAAITAVLEEEKNAYLALDDARLAAVWIQQPSSMKLYVARGIETRFDGWDAIKAHDQENLKREQASASTHRSRFELSNHRITLQGDSAWLTCDARWEGVAEGSPASSTQSRVYVLQKENGGWKIALMAITQLTFEKKT